MYTLPTSNYLKRNLQVNNPVLRTQHVADPLTHQDRIFQELKDLGVSRFGFAMKEIKYLPRVIAEDEHLGGVVYGRHEDGLAMLVATDRRVIFIDTKPLFVNEEEITYGAVVGVTFGSVGFSSTVKLHTRMRDYNFRTYNNKCALGFVQFIENRSIIRPGVFEPIPNQT